MKNILIFIILFLSSVYANSEDRNIDLHFSGYKFNIPAGYYAIGSNGGNDNFLAFRYGEELGKKYIAFTKILPSEHVGYSCSLNIFFSDTFRQNEKTNCNKDEIEAFHKVFIKNNKHAIIEQNGYTLYSTIGESDSFLFFVDPSGQVIKIDTDFLEKEKLLSIVHKYFGNQL